MADATPVPRLTAPAPRADGGALWETIVNGPVASRRLGTSLGLNLLPARSKLCSFDCPYCSCGRNTPRAAGARWPSPDEVVHALRRALERLPHPPDAITFSGNGEPTLHPRFAVVVERVVAARDALAPRTLVAILSNGVDAGVPAVRAALLSLDRRYLKLDPGPAAAVNGAAVDPAARAAAFRALKPYTVQAVVTKGEGWDASDSASVAAWVEEVAAADPDAVELSGLTRAPADPRVQNVPRERLQAMADAIRSALPRCAVRVL